MLFVNFSIKTFIFILMICKILPTNLSHLPYIYAANIFLLWVCLLLNHSTWLKQMYLYFKMSPGKVTLSHFSLSKLLDYFRDNVYNHFAHIIQGKFMTHCNYIEFINDRIINIFTILSFLFWDYVFYFHCFLSGTSIIIFKFCLENTGMVIVTLFARYSIFLVANMNGYLLLTNKNINCDVYMLIYMELANMYMYVCICRFICIYVYFF